MIFLMILAVFSGIASEYPCYIVTDPVWMEYSRSVTARMDTAKLDTAPHGRTSTNILKSKNDPKEYRFVVLDNGIECLVVSNPETQRVAASVAVKSGYMNDPKDRQGLAHFLEHLLFAGTSQYPSKSEYLKFLSDRGAVGNAVTSLDRTVYFFEAFPKDLEAVLDRFSQFFVSPLFDPGCVIEEVQTVHLEYELFFNNEHARMFRLLAHLSRAEHPFHNFGVGNNSTLVKKGLGNQTVEMYNLYYSSQNIKACIYGSECLDQLERLAREKFGQIPQRTLTEPQPDFGPRYDSSVLGKLVWLKPVSEQRKLYLMFDLPIQTRFYKQKPAEYVLYVLGHEGENCLGGYLKSKKLITKLYSQLSNRAHDSEMLVLELELTRTGLENHSDIIRIVFRYIEMMRDKGPLEYIYRDWARIRQNAFDNMDSMPPSTAAYQCSSNLWDMDPQDVLSGPHLLERYDPMLIQDTMDRLGRTNGYMVIVQKENLVDYKCVEEFYRLEYSIEDFDFDQAVNQSLCGDLNQLGLPGPNSMIPTEFAIKGVKRDSGSPPEIIATGPGMRVWHKLDDQFLLPTSHIHLVLRNGAVFESARTFAMTEMYVWMVSERLESRLYEAQIAGYNFSIRIGMRGVFVSVMGYDDKMEQVLDLVLQEFSSHEVDLFESAKDVCLRNLDNASALEPYLYVSQLIDSLLFNVHYLHADRKEELEQVEIDEFKTFLQRLKELDIEVLIYGNETKEDALRFKTVIERHLCPATPFVNTPRVLESDEKRIERQVSNNNNGLGMYIQLGSSRDDAASSMIMLLNQIMKQQFFDDIRVNSRLSYVCFQTIREDADHIGITYIVQHCSSHQVMLSKVDQFIQKQSSVIESMSEETFGTHVQALVDLLLCPKQQMCEEAAEFLHYISEGSYGFGNRRARAQIVKSISKNDFQQFYHEFLVPNDRKRLVVLAGSSDSFGAE